MKMSPVLGIAAIALGFVHTGASASHVVNTEFFVNPTITYSVNSIGIGATIQGEFDIPTLPANSVINFGTVGYLSYQIGGAAWFSGNKPNGYDGDFSGAVSYSYLQNTGNRDQYFSINPTQSPEWAVTVTQANQAIDLIGPEGFSAYLAGSPYDKGGYVPFYFRVDFGIDGYPLSPTGELPSLLLFAGAFSLTTDFDVADGKAGSSRTSTSAPDTGLLWSHGQVGSGGTEIPPDLLAKLPSYVPASIAPVPELPTTLMMGTGLLLLAFRKPKNRNMQTSTRERK